MHNPNPFDFVPFTDKPFLQTPEEFAKLGEPLSGYLELKLKALTPVHIVGYQQPDAKEGQSFMYRQDGRPCIPAATIRGCLRAFLEALTSGWVSQATAEYLKVPGPYHPKKRHIGFRTFDYYVNEGKTMRRTSPPAVNPDFRSSIRADHMIDVASYLFGMVIEPESGQVVHEALARKAKVWVEDAFVDEAMLIKDKHWAPDIKHATQDAFMGGAKPSASNWWYLQPAEVWRRHVNTPMGPQIAAEFVGERFWGRKFYYHQDPDRCRQYYHPQNRNWNYSPDRPFYPIQLECLEQDNSSETFRVYLDKVPESLAALLVLCLLPGVNMRHKLGYGKAYGYGSIEFDLQTARLRHDDGTPRLPATLSDLKPKAQEWLALAWHRERLAANGLHNPILDWQALAHLARILGTQNFDKLLFTYPPFTKKNFMQPVLFEQWEDNAPNGIQVNSQTRVLGVQAQAIAASLFEIKRPIHFQYYQKKAKDWKMIESRTP